MCLTTCAFVSHLIHALGRLFSAILDGEMMVWDPMLEKYLPFGTLKTSALGTYRNWVVSYPVLTVVEFLRQGSWSRQAPTMLYVVSHSPSISLTRSYCFYIVKIFDILYTNILGTEKVLTGETLTERVKVLKSKIPGLAEHNISFFKEIPGRFEFALQRPGKTVKDVEAFLEEVVEARGEGLVLKKHRSGYVLGGREARWWVKVGYRVRIFGSV